MDVVPREVDGLRLLCLDGGDLNCISELRILDEFMYRLQHDTGSTWRPCQYFHSITGVGASGVVAIFLGVLGLSIEETITAFLRLYSAVSLDEGIDPHKRSELLIAATKVLLLEHGIEENSRLCGDLIRGDGCKVSIPCLSAVDMTSSRILRSYESRHASLNPTIVDAIRISWAIPGLFSPVRIGAELMQEEVISAVDGCNNPTLNAIEEAHQHFSKDRRVSCLLSLGAGRPSARSSNMDQKALAQKLLRDTEGTAEQLRRRYNGLRVYFRLSLDYVPESFATPASIEETIMSLNSYTSTYLNTHGASEILDACVMASRQTSHITLEHLYRTRVSGSRSSHGLPALSAFFVARKRPMDEINDVLKYEPTQTQRVAIVIGMGGSGKTQLSLKYAYENDDQYDHVIFVDASSTSSIQNGILNRVRLLDRSLNPTTVEEALQLLAQPRGNISRNWLIIMDNADNPDAQLGRFIPRCDFGAILITTRNSTLGNLSPNGSILLDVMSKEEAVKLLLFTALGPAVRYTHRDQEYAAEIAELLGYLPVAIVQAGCYIKLQKCLSSYADRLRDNRARLLRKPALAQRDVLKYDHSVYAAFDTTLDVLSPLALQVLGILSFAHFADFPCSLFGIAASYGFEYEPYHLLDRSQEYQESVDLLKTSFCPAGVWDEGILDSILEELQQYSMVTLVPVYSIITLRFHPLIHAWGKDRLREESASLRAAAVRLLVCGTHVDNQYIWEYILPHLKYLSPASKDLHVNDRAALTSIIRHFGEPSEQVKMCKDIYQNVREVHGEKRVETSRAALLLADAYGRAGDLAKMREMEKSVVEIRSQVLGPSHPETSFAMACLARTLKDELNYSEASELEVSVLHNARETSQQDPRSLVDALKELAITRRSQGLHSDATALLKEALEIVEPLMGQAHTNTIALMELLSSCYALQGDLNRMEEMKQRMRTLKKKLDGHHYAVVLGDMASVAQVYYHQKKYAAAESQWKEVRAGWQEISGDIHEEALTALHWQALAVFSQNRFEESANLWRQALAGRQQLNGPQQVNTLNILGWLAEALFSQQKYQEAGLLRREQYNGRRKLLGEQHLDTLKSLYSLGRATFEQGNYAEAATSWREELKERRQLSKEPDEDTLDALHWLGQACYAQGQYDESERLWRTELAGERRLYGRQDTNSLNTLGFLADALFKQKKYKDAENIRREQYEGRRELLGVQNAETLESMYSLARDIFQQGRYIEAEELWKEVVDERRHLYGNAHIDTLNSLHWQARATFAQMRFEEAESLWREDLSSRRQLGGDLDMGSLNTLGWLAEALYRQTKYHDAEMVRRQQFEGRYELQGERHVDTLHALNSLARVVFEQGRHSEAKALYRDLVDKMKDVLGGAHPETRNATEWLQKAVDAEEKDAPPGDRNICPVPAGGHSTACLPSFILPQPQRYYAWFRRFQQTEPRDSGCSSPSNVPNSGID